MKLRNIFVLGSILGAVLMLASVSFAAAYEIWTIYDLQDMEDDLAGDYVLMADIDASATNPNSLNFDSTEWGDGTGFRPVGYQWVGWPYTKLPFTGTFDGNGYTINNLYINRTVQTGPDLDASVDIGLEKISPILKDFQQ